ncbi:cell division protein FtsK [Actinorhabdospora filicis]|uniref:Cell division protein FtsK n=1 Tax=Actinorhabdospora filicis TaxID=1785913 RepID=A0A9W6W7F5_9ACTN|nr:FtsK/SpoIIIE domain-containing protein [Actinorhabdospora filicis]GLZ75893.1 cell division protein FtsK [Actinorhabdospora filicis]
MAGWRTVLADTVSRDLATARDAARALREHAQATAAYATETARRTLEAGRDEQARLAAEHRDRTTALEDQTAQATASTLARLAALAKEYAPGAAGDAWADWHPTTHGRGVAPGLLRIGVLDAPGEPPALAPLLDRAHLVCATDPGALLPGILLRALGTTPPGSVQLTVYDPERLGGSLAGLAPLAPAGLLSFVGPNGLSDMLDELVEQIRRINETVLAGEYHSLLELAEKTGRRPEPWRVAVLLDDNGQDDWTAKQRAQLARILRTGVACGVHVIVQGDPGELTGPDVESVTATGTSMTADFAVRLDPPPPATLVTGTCRTIAERFAAGPDPAVFGDLLPADDGELWTHSSAAGLTAPIGEGAEGRLIEVTLGDNPPHALIGGPSGAGKTNLLYAWIGALTARYGPDELALYLLDFKEGVSFARFARGRRDPSWLPHVRLVGVNINDDREFGLALLRHLRDELRRRAEAAKRHEATKLEELRHQDPGGRWPRIVAIIDEFQVLLDGRDQVSNEAVGLLEDLARRGRSQGIHLVLASQDVAGIEALWGRPALVAQFTLRVALPKARRILAETNTAADEIPRYHAVVNSDSGVTSANRVVRVPDASNRSAWDPLQQRLWRQRPADNDEPRLFDGDHVPSLTDAVDVGGTVPTALLGQTIDVSTGSARLRLTRTVGRNLAILGTRTQEACDILASAAISVARQGEARFTIFCPDPDARPAADRLALTLGAEMRESLAEVLGDLSGAESGVPHLVLLYAVDAASGGLDALAKERFRQLLLTGPERRIHTLGWWRSVPRLREDLGGFAARFDSIDAWLALDVHGPELAPLSPIPGGPPWYPRPRRGLFFDRAVHRHPEVVIPYDTAAATSPHGSMLLGEPHAG